MKSQDASFHVPEIASLVTGQEPKDLISYNNELILKSLIRHFEV